MDRTIDAMLLLDSRINSVSLAFDVIVLGWGTPFSVSLVDVKGVTHTASFDMPVPEPATLLVIGAGLGLVSASRRRRKQRA